MQLSLDNAKDFNDLRQNMPGLLSGAASLIESLEGPGLCNVTMAMADPSMMIPGSNAQDCANSLNGIL